MPYRAHAARSDIRAEAIGIGAFVPHGGSQGIEHGDRVLDVGCATGEMTRLAARRASCGRAVGVDLSAQMIDLVPDPAHRPASPGAVAGHGPSPMFSLADPGRVEDVLGRAGFVEVHLEAVEWSLRLGDDANAAAAFFVDSGPATSCSRRALTPLAPTTASGSPVTTGWSPQPRRQCDPVGPRRHRPARHLAVDREATAVLSVGLAPGVTNLLARLCRDRLPAATAIDLTLCSAPRARDASRGAPPRRGRRPGVVPGRAGWRAVHGAASVTNRRRSSSTGIVRRRSR